ncbi:MAG: cytoskeleton protein RodZ [Sphingomonadales bacterium]|nr:cytoskeleton protein RodZ [Sphingomonadales bacterium]MEA3044465.1 cytoskeleton protein RodZ [Sphingomonadales bacterium]MEA3045985.1 cytoskeleton protein RodZ [Sphingomonadales bacterium]
MTDQVEPEEEISLGEQLRRAREAKGLSLDDVAGRTRIPIRHLQNIEREDWDALPAVTYAIGFTRNYANAVGLDGAVVGRELRARIGGAPTRAAAPQYYAQADPARVPPRSLALVAILIAVVLVGGYLIWRSTLADDPAIVPAPDLPQAGPAPASPPAPAPQAAAGQPVTLVATGDVWLRVTEGPSGPSIFTGSMNAGDRYQLPATARHPVIRTGRPQNLRAAVGDRDLGPLAPSEQVIENVSLLPQDLAARARGVPPPR